MKYRKYLFIMMLIFSFAIVSCKKTVTEPEESYIVGKWQISGLVNKWMITITSDQLIKIPYTGTGQITSFGSYNSVFNGLILLSSDPLIIAAVELEYGMLLTDAIIINGITGIGTTSSSNTDQTFEGIVNYTFDGTNLTITESILTNPQNAAETVTVNGALSFNTEEVLANTQTLIQAPDIWMTYYYTSSYTLQFNDDNTFSRTRYINHDLVNEEGTWTMENDILTLNFGEEIETYSINTDVRTIYLVSTKEICDNESDANCFNEYETLFGLDQDSLVNLGVEITAVFSISN